MNITKEQIDELNAVVKVAITKDDYQDKVDSILKDYKKQANIPGFRKGQVPMALIKKQYGKAVLVDEVNKLLQDNLNKYLTEEKLDVLGNPLPKQQDGFDWTAEDFAFEFELGLAPNFEVPLKTKKAILHYKIVADKKMVDEQIERIQKQYGKLISKSEIGKKDENADVERCVHVCDECKNTMKKLNKAGENDLRFLNHAIWSEENTVKAAAIHIISEIEDKNRYSWIDDLLDMVYIDDELKEICERMKH